MRVHGTHRRKTAHDEPAAESVPIEAEGPDWATARDALHAQVPEGHQLLHITVGDRA